MDEKSSDTHTSGPRSDPPKPPSGHAFARMAPASGTFRSVPFRRVPRPRRLSSSGGTGRAPTAFAAQNDINIAWCTSAGGSAARHPMPERRRRLSSWNPPNAAPSTTSGSPCKACSLHVTAARASRAEGASGVYRLIHECLSFSSAASVRPNGGMPGIIIGSAEVRILDTVSHASCSNCQVGGPVETHLLGLSVDPTVVMSIY